MTAPATVARVEGAVQVVILVFMGGMAGAASFVHIHDVTIRHGQPSWIGWANAVVIELMSIVAGLEIRRRKRAAHSTGSVVAVLLVAVGISLAAQVATAQPSVWGWVVAALPALGLLAVVKIVLSRTAATAGPDRDQSSNTGSGPADPLSDRVSDRVADRPAISFHVLEDAPGRPRSETSPTAGQPGFTRHPVQREDRDRSTACPPQTTGARGLVRVDRTASTGRPEPCPAPRSGPVTEPTAVVIADRLDEDVVGLGRTVAARLAEQDRPLTRSNLVDGIRAAGHCIGTDKASALLRLLKSPTAPRDSPPDSPPKTEDRAAQTQPAPRAASPATTPPRPLAHPTTSYPAADPRMPIMTEPGEQPPPTKSDEAGLEGRANVTSTAT